MKTQLLTLALLFAIMGLLALTASASLIYVDALRQLCNCPIKTAPHGPKPKLQDRLDRERAA